ncbi:NAD(P)H-dependent oxidoreductase [Staphylococcus croceilyticus]|uniref:FMN-dependent NADPH-azoreductase n=2 Tax=Staphylococcus TaxID=1279 RepID=A0A4Z1BGA4_9STAP|nr:MULTISPECIES: NADPH-dependent FMN reductase [Staphylococcus]RTX88801.1 NAD(P)H-dependent oxidoreductase [Staphylococcus carnosus]PNZ65724.1 FMN-dependent NADH-azoreductase [Staphylococcus croceilyticus]TGA75040.1 NAD(P)H-dependent oxidoreductase [Staphylococcus croceilyticus]TGN24450.1 NAD(P)H-dependent oxidoreductase [Staphylococcus pragensis]GGG97967.1 FMN-dependent NADPH-azoreductase [Staphylococcus pragensis]
MKGLIIVGSAQVGSHTNALAKYLVGQFDNHDMDVDIFDLAEKPLNQLDFSGTTPSVDEIKANTKEFKEKTMEADFLILGTPNYHGSYSGILKNALDHVNMDYFKMKPVGLIGNSGGIVSSEPLSHLRVIVRSLLGIAVPTQIATHDSDYGKLDDGTLYLDDEQFQLRAKLFVDQIVSFVNNSPYEHLK